jgi:hypothetical protein
LLSATLRFNRSNQNSGDFPIWMSEVLLRLNCGKNKTKKITKKEEEEEIVTF